MMGKIPDEMTRGNLLDNIVHEGKMLYYLDLVLPETPDSLKVGFTAAQLKWCEESEESIWAFLLQEDLLFSSRLADIQRLIGEGPSTKGMPQESPARAAVWTGWQIVREFMERNPEVTIQQLFEMKDGQQILKKSGYRPG